MGGCVVKAQRCGGMWGTAADGARDGAEMRGAQRGGTWAHVRGMDTGETRGTAMCAPRGPGCTWRVYEGCGQCPLSHGSGMDALGYAHLHANSDFIGVSDGVHSLASPTSAAFFAQRYALVSDWGSTPGEPMRYHAVRAKHVSWWPCCAVMFCIHGQGGDTAREGHGCT